MFAPTADSAIKIRQQMAKDLLRPLYHFLPPCNWMNDPNGLIQWEGQYHLFYQYNPDDAVWGNIHWGHAVSDDLVHWRDLPVALAPTPGGPDRDGCWSGCAVDDGGTLALVYTGVTCRVPAEAYGGVSDAEQVVCLAASRDGLVTWEKYEDNPVIAEPPVGFTDENFRDPYVWREDDGWYAVIAGGVPDGGGAVLLYRSPDLRRWEYVGSLLVGDTSGGSFFECPSFFPLGGKHALVVGALYTGESRYYVGTYTDHTFTVEGQGTLDYGIYYAPQVMVDAVGRCIVFAWAREGGWEWHRRHDEALRAPGWAGVSPLSRVLSLGPGNTLVSQPVPELAALRGEHVYLGDIALDPADEYVLPVGSNCTELLAEFDPGEAAGCGLKLFCTPDGDSTLSVAYDRAQHRILIVNTAPVRRGSTRSSHTAPLELAEGETLKLHVFLDRSIVEVFANDRCAITTRVYPDANRQGIRLFATDGSGHLVALDSWQMEAIWPTQ
jgi:beta-fructofuranosidase